MCSGGRARDVSAELAVELAPVRNGDGPWRVYAGAAAWGSPCHVSGPAAPPAEGSRRPPSRRPRARRAT